MRDCSIESCSACAMESCRTCPSFFDEDGEHALITERNTIKQNETIGSCFILFRVLSKGQRQAVLAGTNYDFYFKGRVIVPLTVKDS